MTISKDAASLIGANAYDNKGEKIGKIEEIYLDDVTGEPTFAAVATGWFGLSQSLVPLEGATSDAEGIRVAYDEDVVKDAPRQDADQHLDESEQDALYAYYRGRGTDATVDRDRTDVDVDRDLDRDRADLVGDRDLEVDRTRETGDASVTLREESLNVGKEQVETGRVRLRKYTTTENQTVTVPVTTERIRVERTPVSGDTRTDAIGDTDDQVEEVVLREERPVVTKETHAVEEVSLGKEAVTENRQVTDEVRKEHVEVEGADDVDAGRLGDDRRDRI